jgi:hypothetical protein
MSARPRPNTVPDVSADERDFSDHIKHIRKLRWIGLEQEAEREQLALCRRAPTGSVLTIPRDTD